MSDTVRIKDLGSELSSAESGDFLAIDDISANETKKITAAGVMGGMPDATTGSRGVMSAADKVALAGAVAVEHSHSNKTTLDSYDQTNANLSDAVSKKHAHANKSLLDTYTNSDEDITGTIEQAHSHANLPDLEALVSHADASGALNSDGLQDESIVAGKIAMDTITGNKIAHNTFNSFASFVNEDDGYFELGGGVIAEINIADSAVTAGKIAMDTITGNKIAHNTFNSFASFVNEDDGYFELGGGVIAEINIADSAVTADKIADSAVTADKIPNMSITNQKLNISNGFEFPQLQSVGRRALTPSGGLTVYDTDLGRLCVYNDFDGCWDIVNTTHEEL